MFGNAKHAQAASGDKNKNEASSDVAAAEDSPDVKDSASTAIAGPKVVNHPEL